MQIFEIAIDFVSAPRLGNSMQSRYVHSIPSDRLFSWISIGWIRLYGLDDYRNVVQKFISKKPAWKHSDLFPYKHGHIWLPAPRWMPEPGSRKSTRTTTAARSGRDPKGKKSQPFEQDASQSNSSQTAEELQESSIETSQTNDLNVDVASEILLDTNANDSPIEELNQDLEGAVPEFSLSNDEAQGVDEAPASSDQPATQAQESDSEPGLAEGDTEESAPELSYEPSQSLDVSSELTGGEDTADYALEESEPEVAADTAVGLPDETPIESSSQPELESAAGMEMIEGEGEEKRLPRRSDLRIKAGVADAPASGAKVGTGKAALSDIGPLATHELLDERTLVRSEAFFAALFDARSIRKNDLAQSDDQGLFRETTQYRGWLLSSDDEAVEKLRACLDFMCEEGIGAKRSIGSGAIKSADISPAEGYERLIPSGRRKPVKHIILSPCCPTPEFIEQVESSPAGSNNFLLSFSGGWIYDEDGAPTQDRKPLTCAFETGSAFSAKPEGRLVEVGNEHHPSYRYGFPFVIST